MGIMGHRCPAKTDYVCGVRHNSIRLQHSSDESIKKGSYGNRLTYTYISFLELF